MKTYICFCCILLLIAHMAIAQNVPACITALNKKSSLTNTQFVKPLTLKDGRTVFQFKVSSAAQCMDCPNGTIYYDSNCNVVASFIMGRTASGYVANGYTAGDFGKSQYPNIRYGKKNDSIPACISKAMLNEDSLINAGVKKVVQVRISNKTLYYFEHIPPKATANCKDCSTSMHYYNENCEKEATFTVGGIAGAKASEGYTMPDYYNRQVLQILWNAR